MKNRILNNIEPADVFKYFEDLTFIPRESGNEKEVSDYLVDFAVKHDLEWYQDTYYNVLIKKSASPGYEDHPTVLLQAHMDMVCEKNMDSEHDFDKDPVKFTVEDGQIIAKDTTLGADDGIGVAMALAVLADNDIKHPDIEFLCTADEERGMQGIENFDLSILKGEKVINLDGADEEFIVVGCAGGPISRVSIPITLFKSDKSKLYYKITLKGLCGGHSGEDIHRGRANANKLMARVLMDIHNKIGFDLADISGGLRYNAIPRNAAAIVAINSGDLGRLEGIIDKYSNIFKNEYRVNDPDIMLICEPVEAKEQILSEESKMNVLNYIYFSDNGVIRRDMDNPELVESSVSLGIVSLNDDNAEIWSMVRSSKVTQCEMIYEKIARLAKLFQGTCEVISDCPVWEYDESSELKEIFRDVYFQMYGKEPSFMILHAAVELSKFAENASIKKDMISLGPDIRNLHAPGEYVDIASTGRIFESIKRLLELL